MRHLTFLLLFVAIAAQAEPILLVGGGIYTEDVYLYWRMYGADGNDTAHTADSYELAICKAGTFAVDASREATGEDLVTVTFPRPATEEITVGTTTYNQRLRLATFSAYPFGFERRTLALRSVNSVAKSPWTKADYDFGVPAMQPSLFHVGKAAE